METGFGKNDELFPQSGRIKSELRTQLSQTIFQGFGVSVDKLGPQKRLILKKGSRQLPYMVWSAGQREFVPLLLGLYWLLPPTKTPKRGEIEWVVIEELEMGLHPRAISTVILIVLELLQRGYRVCLSTHSPRVLDVIWALNMARTYHAKPGDVLDIFGVEHKGGMMEIARSALQKEMKVYYFDTGTGHAQNISALDPDAADKNEAGWGGLTEFSSHVNDVVAKMVNQDEAANHQ